jgi:hypothetical protein
MTIHFNFYNFLLLENVAKIQVEKKIKKLGENLKNQLLVPGDFSNQRKCLKSGFSWLNQEFWQLCS